MTIGIYRASLSLIALFNQSVIIVLAVYEVIVVLAVLADILF